MSNSSDRLIPFKPYLIRAWHEWMMDNGLTPHLLVRVDDTVSVPREFVKNNEIVLNASTDATGSLSLGNESVCFQARFSGKVHNITLPMHSIVSIFARENGQGMAFDPIDDLEDDWTGDSTAQETAKIDQADVPQDADESESGAHGLTLVSAAVKVEEGEATKEISQEDDEPPPPPQGGGLKLVK